LGDKCEKCQDTGVVKLPDKEEEVEFVPYHKRVKVSGIFNSYVWLKQYGSFPNKGGWTEQPKKFIDMVEWCDLVNSQWTKYNRERDEANAKLSKQMGALIG